MGSSPLLASLNPAQREAVLCTEGPVLILAGAGSGKTRVLTHRVAYLIDHIGVKPWQILAVTFTNKAAAEMKERILTLSNGFGKDAWIGTFHSISARILRVEAERLGYARNFLIFDRDDQKRFVKNVMSELSISEKEFQPEAILNAISGAKSSFVSSSEYQAIAKAPFEFTVARVYPFYQSLLKQNNIMDFDDLLVNPLKLFQEYPDALEKYRSRFSHILVDEFQDTNRTQYLFLNQLAAAHKNLCVVGDDDQSIYRWRGADIQNILNIEKDYPNCKIFHLEQNYRSTKFILNTANSIVRNNQFRRQKTLWTEKGEGEKVTVLELDDAMSEALIIVGTIKDELLAGGRGFSDFAILYRTNAQSRLLEEALRRSAIPYIVVGGFKFYERKEIKDVLAYLRLICNPKDSVSFKRVINFPLRGIGESSILKLEEFARVSSISILEAAARAEEVMSITPRVRKSIVEFHNLIAKYTTLRQQFSGGELAQALVDEIGILRSFKEINTEDSFTRAENVRELLLAITNYSKTKGASLETFLEEITLITDIDSWDDKSNAVTLMTLHSAKGLEFPVVFITGLEEGLFPLSRTFDNPADLEEERRLFYVGVTRAEERLFISWAALRPRFGETFSNLPSRFVKELDPAFVETKNLRRSFQYRSERAVASTTYVPIYDEPIYEFSDIVTGREVKHELFGIGKIIKTDGRGESMKITVRFYDAGEKRLVVKYANLEILS
jgi:DNA helicase-2/ATP-dependent DNA helicase PcrA